MGFSASDPAPPPRGRRWLWWSLGGCGGAVVLVVAAIVVAIIVIAHNATSSGDCLPSGFPVAPHLEKVTAISVANTCTTVYRAQGSPRFVDSYYASALNGHGWEVVSRQGNTVRFRRPGTSGEVGEVTATSTRGRTQVTVALHRP